MLENLLLATKSFPAFLASGNRRMLLKNTKRYVLTKRVFDYFTNQKKSINKHFISENSRFINWYKSYFKQLLYSLFSKELQLIILQPQHNNTPIF